MSQRKRSAAPRKPQASPDRHASNAPVLTILNPNAAGIDVHSDMHMVCVPARASAIRAERGGGLPANVRRFGANSCDLVAIADWLKECGVTTVAMESTGVYWIPLFELLEARGFEVWLVEPGQLSRCGARPKTDVLDVQWIQRRRAYNTVRPHGLRSATSRRPPRPVSPAHPSQPWPTSSTLVLASPAGAGHSAAIHFPMVGFPRHPIPL